MKTNTVLLFSLLALYFSACKKSKQDDGPYTPPFSGPKVKQTTYSSNNTTRDFEYDGKGRLKRMLISDGNRYEYTYTPGKITGNRYNASNTPEYTEVWELDANGLAIKNYPTLPASDYNFTYTYDANRQVTSSSQYMGGLTKTFKHFRNNGLLDSIQVWQDNKITQRIFYLYYSNITYTYTDEHRGMFFLGKQTANAYKKIVYQFYNNNGSPGNSSVYNYTYETDSQGRIAKQIVTGASSYTLTITYY